MRKLYLVKIDTSEDTNPDSLDVLDVEAALRDGLAEFDPENIQVEDQTPIENYPLDEGEGYKPLTEAQKAARQREARRASQRR